MVDEAPKAKWYYSDGFDAYARLWYHCGRYQLSEGKADTYSVEADNAELSDSVSFVQEKRAAIWVVAARRPALE